jgi:hypothetical protein
MTGSDRMSAVSTDTLIIKLRYEDVTLRIRKTTLNTITSCQDDDDAKAILRLGTPVESHQRQ